MFDKARLQEILVQYKKDFVDFEWANEKYKWVAVQNFQENWDVNAQDFAGMTLGEAVKKAETFESPY